MQKKAKVLNQLKSSKNQKNLLQNKTKIQNHHQNQKNNKNKESKENKRQKQVVANQKKNKSKIYQILLRIFHKKLQNKHNKLVKRYKKHKNL